jgi:hypothetical protein
MNLQGVYHSQMKERTTILDRERDGMKGHDVEGMSRAPARVLGSILRVSVQPFEMYH